MTMETFKSLIILFKTQQVLENHVKKSLEKSELSVNEFAAMEALYTKGRLTTQQLIESVLIPNSSMTYVLDRLRAKHYIERIKDSNDRRVQWIMLTGLGKQVFEVIYHYHFQHMRDLFDVLDQEEEFQLQAILKKLGHHAKEQLDENTL